MRLRKIISGGQTGADIAGLKAAKIMGLETGGWMPKNFKTLAGLRPDYAETFGMQEHPSASYPDRTEQNVLESDCTLRFASNFDSAGELCTLRCIKKHNKPWFDVNIAIAGWAIENSNALGADKRKYEIFRTPQHCYQWLVMIDPEVINIAGNSEQTCPGIEKEVEKYLCEVFSLIKAYQTEDRIKGALFEMREKKIDIKGL